MLMHHICINDASLMHHICINDASSSIIHRQSRQVLNIPLLHTPQRSLAALETLMGYKIARSKKPGVNLPGLFDGCDMTDARNADVPVEYDSKYAHCQSLHVQ